MITHTALEILAQSGNVIDPTVTAPPGSDKILKLIGVGLWLCFGALVMLTGASGVKFATAFFEGSASAMQKWAVVGCGGGSVITGTAASIVSFFM